MDKRFVITINRHCGSGGGTIGRKIASKLGINYYDKELIEFEDEDSSIDPSALAQADERVKSSLYSRLYKNTYNGVLIDESDPDFDKYQELFLRQAKAIRSIASSENCVVVGRCADFVLSDCEGRVSVFITADEKQCISGEMDRLSITNKEAKDRIRKINAYRRAYYLHHTGKVWDSPEHYDLFLSSSEHSYEECADIIIEYLNEISAKESSL